MKIKFLIGLTAIFLNISAIIAQDAIPTRPQPARLVNDIAKLLSTEQRDYLEQKLVRFSDTTGTQIALVIVPSLQGYDRAEFTYLIHKNWGVGQQGKDNGIVVMIKPKTFQEQGAAFISTGRGLEGVIPDLTAKNIIEYEMIPYFKQDLYFAGVNRAADVLMSLASSEFSAADYDAKNEPNPLLALFPFLFVGFFFIIALFQAKRQNASLGKDTSFWTLLMLMAMSNRSHSGSWGGFSGGGGRGGGGFGGFGGGSSGGGGAGGSW
jgi:uncharacterized protein